MERFKIEALPREKRSKGNSRQLRSKGMIPAVVYGRGVVPRMIILEGMTLKKALTAGSNVLLDLQIKGDNGTSTETVMVKELQKHPLQRDFLLHADLIRISLKEKLEVAVPLNFTGEPGGIKEGGVFQVQLREVSVRCLPTDIPEYIDVPIENLGIGDALTVADLKLPKGMEMLEDENEYIASVLAPHGEKAKEGEEGVEEPEEEKQEE
ncbi:MAG: 50S ribosomal protein L25 [Dethiobacter sp.]|jgi:large subunit ribosomal protein L25|nr:MAG: 50S ribosomal protein L25 [Dethiobacter sp.]